MDVSEKIENVLDKRKDPYTVEELIFSPSKEKPLVQVSEANLSNIFDTSKDNFIRQKTLTENRLNDMYSKRRSSQELIKRTSSQHELSEEAFAPILPDEGAQK